MKVKITGKTENPLTEREEIKFEVDHKNAPTPSRAQVLEELSSELGEPEEKIVIEKLATPHGRQFAIGIARVYESKDSLKEFEPGYLTKRTENSKEKEAEEEAPEEEESEE